MMPKLGIHVDINSWTLDRAMTTGHPRLLKQLLTGTLAHGVLSNVTITALLINGKEWGNDE